MSHAVDELWAVATGASPHVDASTLARAIEDAAASDEPLDYRTRLLIRDGLRALATYWHQRRYEQWLENSPVRGRIQDAVRPESFDENPDEIGFPSLKRRVMDATTPENILQFFRELSRHVHQPTRLNVGRSLALILRELLSRQTEDADVVNEVPTELREQHDVLRDLANRYGLQLTHIQSHYLPSGWEHRLSLLDVFGQLEIYLVDAYDVMISKLCSKRAKDLDDLRVMKPNIDRDTLHSRLSDAGHSLLAEERLREAAEKNWYILFGEPLA